MTSLPLLGAAMSTETLTRLQRFILDDQRDLELQDFCEAQVLNGDWKPIADRAKSLLEGYSGRLGIHGPFWGLSLANPDPEIRDIVARRIGQGLDVCAYLGATQMVIHSPYTTWDYNNLDNHPARAAYDRIMDYTHQTLDAQVKRAEALGVTLVLENIEDICPSIRCALAESFASRAVAVSVDTGHAHYAHGSNGGPPVDYYIRRAGAQLQHIHLQDADGHADRHWAIGEGSIAWAAVFRAVAECGSNPRLILELRDHGGIERSVAYLRQLGLAG